MSLAIFPLRANDRRPMGSTLSLAAFVMRLDGRATRSKSDLR